MRLYGTPKEEISPFREVEASSLRASPTNFLRDQIVAFFQPSDNKLAMKLFGNKSALMKEKLRQKAAGNWVIHPCSNFRSVTRPVSPLGSLLSRQHFCQKLSKSIEVCRVHCNPKQCCFSGHSLYIFTSILSL